MSEKKDQKGLIKDAIEAFASGDLTANALHLLKTLGYHSDLRAPLKKRTFAEFDDLYVRRNERFNTKNALTAQWQSIDLLFQLTTDQLSRQDSHFKNEKVDEKIIESYLFFVIELKAKPTGYTRTELSHITREVNKLFAMPAMILFKHSDTLTLSVIDRRLHKRVASKDVLEKVTLIKDIRTSSPHRAHIEILFDLSIDELRRTKGFTTFPALHEAWRKTLDTKELNKKFFRELSNWYFHAVEVTKWPDDAEKDKEKRNAINTIRLITRLMFVWFLREKDLVPDALFDKEALGLGGKGGSGGKGGRSPILKPDAKEKSLYYKAILQNLFFATLNTEMGDKRRFRIEADRSQSKHYFIHNVFRYERCFTDPKATLKDVFAPIPFLNGGLFECLDKQVELPGTKSGVTGKLLPVRIDGFSDRDDNPLHVPDKLFFDPEGEELDFSAVYGTTRARKEKVRGLIDILSSYKFTIVENTPIEEEVALDPELLGKVFENLLANYNPETKTTARKQTGSFYTPREIVNYMVDESLIAYLKSALAGSDDQKIRGSENGNAQDGVETKLRHLLSYTEEPHTFTKGETEKLIAAIDSCKILDPACGSGAFPMGVLHKLVHVLHKLDPQNKQWKERQIEKASALDDADIRERTIADIEDAFANNALDYGRKLYLIENGIYGVDIQPIAMQIAKLRFFISLIVDQRAKPYSPSPREKGSGDEGSPLLGRGAGGEGALHDNRGVRALPNLETKFVAANTLMKLEKENANLFTNPAIEKKKEQLKRVRHDYFEARTPQRKARCRELDKSLREELADLLVGNHDFQPKTAKMLAGWDPYDQNASAPFFDTEWMYGLNEGFNIVIGNPPYLFSGNKGISTADKNYYKAAYVSGSGKFNLFTLFIEAGHDALTQKGTLSYIVPNTFLRVTSYHAARRLLVDSESIAVIRDFGDAVFDATTTAVVLQTVHSKPSANHRLRLESDTEAHDMPQSDIRKARYVIATSSGDEDRALAERLNQSATPLGQLCKEMIFGVVISENHDEVVSSKPKKGWKPYLEGKEISSYKITPSGSYLHYDKRLLHRARKKEIFEVKEKVLLQRITGGERPLKAALDTEQYYNKESINNIILKHNAPCSAKYVLGLLNSSLLNWYYAIVFTNRSRLTVNLSKEYLSRLPIAVAGDKQKAQLEKLVEKRLGLAAGAKAESVEREIDQVVYGLYGLTEEEIGIVEGSVKRKGSDETVATEQ